MNKPVAWFGQLFAYVAFAVFIAGLSTAPAYTHLPPGQALIKLSFSHAGRIDGECRELSAAEIAGTAPNMRRPKICPRTRVPVLIELDLDGKPLLHTVLPPSGLWHDGASTVYRRFQVPVGRHHVSARLRDSRRDSGYDYQGESDIELLPRQNFVVEFSAVKGGFSFK